MKVLTVFGTRPEAIKMAPLVKHLQAAEGIDARVCVTAQHRQVRQCLAARPGTGERDLTIAVLGLAFKPNIDDLRESPALHIAEQLMREINAQLLFVEPNVKELPRTHELGRLVDLDTALARSDVVVVLVAHREFADLRAKLADRHAVIDVVGVLD